MLWLYDPRHRPAHPVIYVYGPNNGEKLSIRDQWRLSSMPHHAKASKIRLRTKVAESVEQY